MRNRSRHGWRRVVNGVNLAALLVFLFIAAPLYWMIATNGVVFQTSATISAAIAGTRVPRITGVPSPMCEKMVSRMP